MQQLIMQFEQYYAGDKYTIAEACRDIDMLKSGEPISGEQLDFMNSYGIITLVDGDIAKLRRAREDLEPLESELAEICQRLEDGISPNLEAANVAERDITTLLDHINMQRPAHNQNLDGRETYMARDIVEYILLQDTQMPRVASRLHQAFKVLPEHLCGKKGLAHRYLAAAGAYPVNDKEYELMEVSQDNFRSAVARMGGVIDFFSKKYSAKLEAYEARHKELMKRQESLKDAFANGKAHVMLTPLGRSVDEDARYSGNQGMDVKAYVIADIAFMCFLGGE